MHNVMKCPVCQVELKIAERAGIEIDYCPNCRGVWLDRGELDKIIERYAQSTTVSAPLPPETASPPPRRAPEPPPAHPYPKPAPYDDDEPYPKGHPRRRKRNWLEELFDVFD